MSTPVSTPVSTPLAAFLQAATPEQRERCASLAGSTVGYLYQLAGCHRPNPRARLAMRLEEATRVLSKETRGVLPVVTASQLATMCDLSGMHALD